MKIFLAFFLQNIYFSYLCSDFLMDIKMKQTQNMTFLTLCQCNTGLYGECFINIIMNVRAMDFTVSKCHGNN